MKRLVVGIVLVSFLAFLSVGCTKSSKGSTQLQQDQAVVGQQQDIYSKAQTIPLFNYSQTRQSLIEINTALANGVTTWSVFTSYTGVPLYSCPSIGFPIPADTQLTNPEQLVRIKISDGNYIEGTLPQAEPNGTYTSQNTNATYVLCVRNNGSVAAVYSEPMVISFPYEVEVRNGQIIDKGGQSSFEITTNKNP